jgi:hydrogenase nickel incorporation protein HypA/HybF
MHELPVTRSILEIVLRHAAANRVTAIRSVELVIGGLSDLEAEWLQRYFDHLSRGTVAQGARLQVRRSPLTFSCDACARRFEVDRNELDDARCPVCGAREAALIGGTGYRVESMEACAWATSS